MSTKALDLTTPEEDQNLGLNDGLPMALTDAELAMLTDTERATIEALDATIPENDSDDTTDPKADADGGGDDKDEAADEDGTAENKVKDAEPEPDPEPEDDPKPKPEPKLMDVPDVKNLDEKISSAREELRTLNSKFADADLTEEQFEAAQTAQIDIITQAQTDKRIADAAIAHNDEALNGDWYAHSNAFIASKPALQNPNILKDFETVIDQLNKDSSAKKLNDEEFTAKAWDTLKARYDDAGLVLKDDARAPAEDKPEDKAEDKETKDDTVPRPRTDARKMPPDGLSQLPQSDVTGPGDAKFYALDNGQMDALEREQAFSSMSEAEKNKYLMGG